MPDEINAAFFPDLGLESNGGTIVRRRTLRECAEDSAVTARDCNAFAIFTGLEHAEEFFGIDAAI